MFALVKSANLFASTSATKFASAALSRSFRTGTHFVLKGPSRVSGDDNANLDKERQHGKGL